ncbi:acetate kinase [Hydrogenophaga sp.]|uniref:acetate kinase n=1 Tax=Hydrogenophaga sp. TaxID=1904254 RepID=UPI00391A72BF
MNAIHTHRSLRAVAGAVLVLSSACAHAQTSPPRRDMGQRVQALERLVADQGRQIESLRQELLEQTGRQQELERSLAQFERDAQEAQASAPPPVDGAAAPGDTAGRPIRVGVAPQEDPQPPAVAPIFEQPGILTQPGHYVLEPSVQYSYSSSNRVALVGYTVIPALLIGLIDVREVKRNTLTMALAGRWGVTSRLELEMKVPYVYRSDDSISREIFTGSASDRAFNATGSALGDVEFAARYQLNQPQDGNPFLIGSLRFKTRTGKDPFEVVTDCVTRCVGNTTGTGLPLKLPTGSGFYSLQPAITWLFPSDPAVFFGGISYTHNFGRSNISRQVLNGEQEFIGSVKPGNAWGINFGMGLAINERSSFSVGVDLNSIGRTKLNGVPVASSVRTQLSSLLLGYSYRYSAKTTMNVSVGAGLTRDTPDLTLSVRLPMSF